MNIHTTKQNFKSALDGKPVNTGIFGALMRGSPIGAHWWVGVAYDAKLSGHYIQGTGLEIGALTSEVSAALATYKNYDVVNNSWGTTSNFMFNVLPVGTLEVGIADAWVNEAANDEQGRMAA